MQMQQVEIINRMYVHILSSLVHYLDFFSKITPFPVFKVAKRKIHKASQSSYEKVCVVKMSSDKIL